MIENPPEEAAQGARGEQALLAGGNAAAVAQEEQEGNGPPTNLQQLNAVLITCGITSDQDRNHVTISFKMRIFNRSLILLSSTRTLM